MDKTSALASLSALGQETRLDVFRLLSKAGAEGMLAGEIGQALDVRQNTLSSNLAILLNAGLIRNRREGRAIRYFADMGGMRAMLDFLVEDCCDGHPEFCHFTTNDAFREDEEMANPYNVLFLCTGNSARSILAEAIINREGKGLFRGFSAGSRPRGEVHPYTLQLLERLGYDTAFARSKSWDELAGPDAPQMDFVFTVCDQAAEEECPYWPGHPMTAQWSIPDPAAATGTEAERHLAFAEAYRVMRNRISSFLNLPITTLDRIALQKHLDAIGSGSNDAQARPAPA